MTETTKKTKTITLEDCEWLTLRGDVYWCIKNPEYEFRVSIVNCYICQMAKLHKKQETSIKPQQKGLEFFLKSN